ncbi:MAG: hypothetical protein KGH75_09730 [Rhodospirillales bacterium]|nr:hypothetical protein [Rhodospirillales bacterium]
MSITILEAMDDPNLFAPFFKGTSWTAWRAFLAALFALPMDDAAQAIYTRHTGRTDPPREAFKEAALVIGRRGGKSRVLATIAVFLACFRDYEPYLAPGEVATIAIIAADRRQARSIFRYIKGLLLDVPLLKPMVGDETTETLTLNNRVQIEIATASFRVTRGYTFAAVLADETAFWRSDDSANPDVEIFAALRPGLSTIPGSILLNASSPYRKRGVLYGTYAKHYGQNSRVLVWKATTLEMNPALDPRIVEEAYEEDPENASAEYGGEFRNDLSDFIPRDVVDSCTARGLYEIAPTRGTRYVAFIDPAGGTGGDSMTLAVAHRDGDRAVLDAVREIKPPFSPEQATAEFATLLRSYGLSRVTGDRYAGEWPRERMRSHGIEYALSDKPKSDIYRDCLPILNSGRAQLLDLRRLGSQLCGLERRTARSGKDSIDHAPGAHDDVANAACGALLLADAKKIQAARMIRLGVMER